MSAGVHVVTVGASALVTGDPEGGAVVAALIAAGVPVAARVFVDEDESALERALARDGGLTVVLADGGGSAGDVVRRVLARAAGVRLALHDRMLAAIEDSYRRRERAMPRREERLALLPQGAVLWTGGPGDPAWALDAGPAAFVVLPRGSGARPALLDQQLIPLARARVDARVAGATRTLKTAGVSVTEVEERLMDWLGRDGDVSVVVVPAESEVWVRLRVRGGTTSDTDEALRATEAEIVSALGDDCYGRDGDTLEQALARELEARALTLAVAESCTGGLLGHRITSLPALSDRFERGVVVYSLRAKIELLGVPESVLRAHGPVSGPTAEAMARGVCAIASTPCGLAITGSAGPGGWEARPPEGWEARPPAGGTPAAPVGTVFVGLVVPGQVLSRRFLFSGDRAAIKWQSSSMALDMLRRRLGGSV